MTTAETDHYHTVLPTGEPGQRLSVRQCWPSGCIQLAHEVVPPECVGALDARRKTVLEELTLTHDEARWMRNRLTAVLATMEEDRQIEQPPPVAQSATPVSPAPIAPSPLKCIAWCPDDCDAVAAREYVGTSARKIAEQHATHVYAHGPQRECYDVRVRATKGARVREWNVTVDVEVEVSVSAALARPVREKGAP